MGVKARQHASAAREMPARLAAHPSCRGLLPSCSIVSLAVCQFCAVRERRLSLSGSLPI